jgi:hypothetical protein
MYILAITVDFFVSVGHPMQNMSLPAVKTISFLYGPSLNPRLLLAAKVISPGLQQCVSILGVAMTEIIVSGLLGKIADYYFGISV